MRRGNVIIVAAAGDYGKPRLAVIVQTDAFPASHASVVICQMTSEVVDAPAFRGHYRAERGEWLAGAIAGDG